MQEKGYQIIDEPFLSSGTVLAYSKTEISQHNFIYSGGPVIGSAINTAHPCSGYGNERLILNDDQSDKFKFSIEKEDPTVGCPAFDWKE